MTEDRRRRCQRLLRLFEAAPMKATFGMRLSFGEDGRATFTQPYAPGFDHTLGAIHGGVFATLIDNAGWFTAAVEYDTWIATVELQVRLLEPVQRQALRATGRLLRAGHSLAVAAMEVHAGERLVAVGSGTFVPTRTPLPGPAG